MAMFPFLVSWRTYFVRSKLLASHIADNRLSKEKKSRGVSQNY